MGKIKIANWDIGDISDNEALNYALDSGTIDLPSIKDEMAMKKRADLLAMHPYSIWQGKNGKFYTHIPDDGGKLKLKKRSTREGIEDLVVAYWGGQIENPTIEEVFNEWNDRDLELGKISNPTHDRNCSFFKRHYKEMGKRKIKSVSENEWTDFLEEQIPKYGLTAKAFAGLKGVTKGLLKRAKKRGLIDFDVQDMFENLDVSDADFKKVIKEDYQEVFSEEETPIIMNYLTENCDMLNSVILLMFVSGIRVGEAVTLKHFDVSGNTINIRRTETMYSDGNGKYIYSEKDSPKTRAGVRTVVVPDNYLWLLKKIQTFNPSGEFIFARQDKRIHTTSVRKRLYSVCNKLRIYQKSPHKIRKTYATILLDNNVDNRLVIDQMGHTDVLCTEDHYHRNRKSIDTKAKIISEIPDFRNVS